MKFKTNIRIDIALIPAFILLVVSGVGIHLSDEFEQHQAWHSWAVTHVVAAIFFLSLAIIHIKGHWGWFKSIVTTFKKKSKPTLNLTLLFLFETVSGIILLAFTDGGNSHLGLWHWWIGLIMTGFGIGHLLKRWKILKNGLRKLREKTKES